MPEPRGADLPDPDAENEPKPARAPARRIADAFDPSEVRLSIAIITLFAAVVCVSIGGFLVSVRVGFFTLAASLMVVAVLFGYGNEADPEPVPVVSDEWTDQRFSVDLPHGED